MSWLEDRDGAEIDVVIGHCQECVNLAGVRDLSIMAAMADEVSAAQRRLQAHFVSVLHLDSPGIAW